MKRIVMPSDKLNDFSYIMRQKCLDKFGFTFYYNDASSRDAYSFVTWDNIDLPLSPVREWYLEKYPESKIYHQTEDSLVFYDEEKIVYVGDYSAGNFSERELESIWREKMQELLATIEVPSLTTIQMGSHCSSTHRMTPTILLAGRNVWTNNGEPRPNNLVQVVAYKNTASLVYFQNWYPGTGLYDVQDYPHHYIVTPLCVICDNTKYGGVGNTIIITSSSYSTLEDVTLKSLYQTLLDKVMWDKILIPMLQEDFETLKTQFEQQAIPLPLQIKLYKYQMQLGAQTELDELIKLKELQIKDIETYIKEITKRKVNISTYEEKIVEKQKEILKRFSTKKLEGDIRRLKKLPYIKSFEFTTDGICFYTEPIQVDDGPFLGGYKIQFITGSKKLKIENLVNPMSMGSLAHPHIPQNGTPCFGNYTDIYFRFETGDYYIGIELLHEFLSTYNPDDEWGRRLIYWDAKFVFEDMKERDILWKCGREWDRYYEQVYGTSLRDEERCVHCGEYQSDCSCDRCAYCEELTDNCECWICYSCGLLVEDGCNCARCESCNELIRDCGCDRCEDCGELTNVHAYTHCECERCPEYDFILEEDDERCLECEIYDCEHNQNEPPAIQEEVLFPDLDELLGEVA
jgi:hypothetical protein